MPDTKEILERAILDDPDDIAAHSAYADYLTEEGDPRGEFIQVQLALEDEGRSPEERKRLQERERELLDAHEREWLGTLWPHLAEQKDKPEWAPANQHNWSRGWLDGIRLSWVTDSFFDALVATPLVRMLRFLEMMDLDEEANLNKLVAPPQFDNLRVWRFGGGEYAPQADGAADFITTLPRIEEIDLQAHNVDTRRLFAMFLPKLQKLRIDHSHDYPLEVLANNASLSNLTHLSFWPHAVEPGDTAYLNLAGVEAIVRSPHLSALTHLTLYCSDMGDEGCSVIVDSGILSRLKVLDLTYGRITDTGAATLAAAPELRQIELLNLSGNQLTQAGIQLLHQTGINFHANEQMQVGGDEYLFYGDME